MKNKYYELAKEYTDFPGGRYKRLSDFSGEEFRNTILVDLFEQMKKSNHKHIYIDLDGTYGYVDSFLDEAFGGFVEQYSRDNPDIFIFKSQEQPELIEQIKEMIERHL